MSGDPIPISDILFWRLGTVNANGSIPGMLKIGEKSWPTIERGHGYSFVRKGFYVMEMCVKTKARAVNCLCFSESPAIWTHLIHDADNDDSKWLDGCIAPGLAATKDGITGSAAAMLEVFAALNGFQMWKKVTIWVSNNISGDETKDEWIKRREAALAP